MTLDFPSEQMVAAPLSLEIDEPLTQLSSNSLAAVLFEIQKQEHVHWFLGLRQAELTIREKLTALQTNQMQERRYVRDMRRMKREYDGLLAKGVNITPDEEDRIEAIEDEFIVARHTWLDLKPLVRDARMELETAQSQKRRILKQHPEAQDLTFDELQKQYANVAFFEKQARYFAAEAWAAVNHLPSPLGHLLFDLAPQDREMLMLREAELRHGVQIDETTVQAARRIRTLPAADQERIVAALLEAETAN